MLQSLRIGFATNSSSTHSVILHSKYHDRASIPEEGLYEDEYGTTNFSLISPEEKLKFLLIANRGDLARSAHERMEIIAVTSKYAAKYGLDVQEIVDNIHLSGGSDGGECPNGISLETWFDFFLNAPISVYGHNDNYDGPHKAGDVDIQGVEFSRWATTWKQDGKALIAYDKSSGNKMRWSPDPYVKSTTPELVDVKITDFCGYGCKFCYQGSTKQGQHARLEDLEGIFDQLQSMNCFEIAVGGGEPAHHPEFARIIEMAKARNLTFNFTAYGIDWSKNSDILNALKQTKYGSSDFGVGISVHKSADISKIDTARQNLRDAKLYSSVIAQTVIGATPMSATVDLMQACKTGHTPLILLGFKHTGRGKDFKVSEAERHDVKSILETAKSHIANDQFLGEQGFHISVDTAFLDLYGDILDDLRVPTVLRTSPEGAFSMYVDAVEMTAAPSSYCSASEIQPLGDLKAQFAQF